MDELEPVSNVVNLPASPHLFRCGLCGFNIEESVKETMVAPRAFTMPDTEERIWICGTCWTVRNQEVYQALYSRYATKPLDKQKSVTSLLRGEKPLYKIYESERSNALGEKLRIVSWKNLQYGIASIAVWDRAGVERVLMYNAFGSRISEHNVAIEYISKQYEKECGALKLIEAGPVSKVAAPVSKVAAPESPWFRIHLLTLDCTFALYDRRDSVGFTVGISELQIPVDSFLELTKILFAVSSYLRTGTAEGLSISKGKLADQVLSCGRHVVISGSTEVYSLKIGDTVFRLPTFDLADVGLGCSYFRDILLEKSTSRKAKLVEQNRKQRYMWLHSLSVPVSFKMIMRDFGWYVSAS